MSFWILSSSLQNTCNHAPTSIRYTQSDTFSGSEFVRDTLPTENTYSRDYRMLLQCQHFRHPWRSLLAPTTNNHFALRRDDCNSIVRFNELRNVAVFKSIT